GAGGGGRRAGRRGPERGGGPGGRAPGDGGGAVGEHRPGRRGGLPGRSDRRLRQPRGTAGAPVLAAAVRQRDAAAARQRRLPRRGQATSRHGADRGGRRGTAHDPDRPAVPARPGGSGPPGGRSRSPPGPRAARNLTGGLPHRGPDQPTVKGTPAVTCEPSQLSVARSWYRPAAGSSTVNHRLMPFTVSCATSGWVGRCSSSFGATVVPSGSFSVKLS